jgi:hypothetical protein
MKKIAIQFIKKGNRSGLFIRLVGFLCFGLVCDLNQGYVLKVVAPMCERNNTNVKIVVTPCKINNNNNTQ